MVDFPPAVFQVSKRDKNQNITMQSIEHSQQEWLKLPALKK